MPVNVSLPGGRSARRPLFNVRASVAALALLSAAALPLGAAVVDFGDLSLAPSSFHNGGPATNSAGWSSGGVAFGNSFTDFGGFSTWAGFAYSNISDTTTSGFGNQYGAYSLVTPNDGVYGVAYHSAYDAPPVVTFADPVAPQSVRLTNSTFAALEILHGSGFAKKFGGVTGDDPDWFSVTFTGYDADGFGTGTVIVYLADYRFADNASDYLVSDWTTYDLSGLGSGVKTIVLSLASSDVGAFGINTPTYVALDDLAYVAVPEPAAAATIAGLGAIAVAVSRRRRRAVAAA